MIAIFKREFKSYMQSFIGPLFIAALIGLFTLFFILFNVVSHSNNINGTLYNLGYWGLMFLVPILSMRAFSEERRNKTDQLILTAPVSVGSIVLGKFLAMVAVLSIPTALFCVIPPVLSIFGTVPFAWNYVDILGFFLYGVMLISICIFVSNLSDNPIICAVISIIVILIGNLSANFYGNIGNETIKSVLAQTIDFSSRLANTMTGNLDLTSIIYFVSVSALFLFLSTQIIQKRRYSVSKKNFSISAYSTASVVIMVAVAVAANLVAAKIPDQYREVDVTAQNIYSVSDDTKKVVADLNDDIKLYFFADEDDDSGKTKDAGIEKVLKKYDSLSDHISLEYIDPVINPQFAKKYTDATLNYSSVIVVDEATGRSKVVNYNDMYETSVDYTTYQQSVTGYDTEGEITYALQYVTLSEDQLLKAYAVTGHNEVSFTESFADVLTKNNVNVSDLSLLTTESIPDDCNLLILNTPMSDYNDSETQQIIDYLNKGGDVLILTYYQTNGSLTNFNKILEYYGVKNGEGVLVENDASRYFNAQSPYYLLPILGSDSITEGIDESKNQYVFAPLASPLTYEAEDKVTVTELLKTSDTAYVQKFSEPTASAEGGEAPAEDTAEDTTGTYFIGLKAVKELDLGESTAVIYSSGDIFTDAANEVVGGNNLKLFGNTLGALVTFNADLVTIPVKSADASLLISGKAALTMMTVMIVTVVTILIAGLVVWISRRKR